MTFWTHDQIGVAVAAIKKRETDNPYGNIGTGALTGINEALTYALLRHHPDIFNLGLLMPNDVSIYPWLRDDKHKRAISYAKAVPLAGPLKVPLEIEMNHQNRRSERIIEDFLPELIQIAADNLKEWAAYHRADGHVMCARLPLYGSWLRNAQTFNHEVTLMSSFGLLDVKFLGKYEIPESIDMLRPAW